MEDAGMKVGEVARRTGVSVRTLHHYHELGILAPSHHSPGEHRLYTAADLARLREIKSLQALGLSLEEIRSCLEDPDHSPLETIERHIELVGERMELERRLRRRLERVAGLMRASEGVPVEDLVKTIEEIVMLEKYYTPEQLEMLAKRGAEVGEDRMREVQTEWAELFRLYGAAMADGADPASERVRVLAQKSKSLIEEFTGGDPGVRRSLSNMYATEGAGPVLEPHGFELADGLWEYMGRAGRALEEAGDE